MCDLEKADATAHGVENTIREDKVRRCQECRTLETVNAHHLLVHKDKRSPTYNRTVDKKADHIQHRGFKFQYLRIGARPIGAVFISLPVCRKIPLYRIIPPRVIGSNFYVDNGHFDENVKSDLPKSRFLAFPMPYDLAFSSSNLFVSMSRGDLVYWILLHCSFNKEKQVHEAPI
jgi:hypothetical protein